MKLSHTTKVTVRKALAALRSLDSAEDSQRELLERHGYQVVASPTAPRLSTQIARRAGFHNRTELEKFSRRHGLL